MLFIGFIHIERPRSWEETKLHVKHGTIGGKNLIIPQNVGNYIMEQANKMREALASMSEKQDALLEKEMMKDIGKTADSASFEAMRHDVRLSRKNAFK